MKPAITTVNFKFLIVEITVSECNCIHLPGIFLMFFSFFNKIQDSRQNPICQSLALAPLL